ncbi:hypothetical protein AXE80_09815 [Wenyingzhuangia fucanilytica]|uniref:Uncharacterized protein n=1 Tax=Wenyingzhuangia fucanilytica TaxID=1790137 RepID=A0A1B1Y714_9FLAO|nr:hypothetical protein [Wenyingzhuangia fucanilytica]ANW96555.1 hypothetical protein AXE80_09815 [Wenyingzhuangia fucanilytica]
MKNLVWILAMIVGGSLYAQKQSDLMGPEAKNYKPWQNETKATVVVKENNKRNLRSPEFKNYKPWKHKNDKETVAIASDDQKRKLQGPEAKNYKPWRD